MENKIIDSNRIVNVDLKEQYIYTIPLNVDLSLLDFSIHSNLLIDYNKSYLTGYYPNFGYLEYDNINMYYTKWTHGYSGYQVPESGLFGILCLFCLLLCRFRLGH